MENKKRTKEEIIADRNGFLWLLIPFAILFLSGIFIMGYVKGIAGSIAGGFCVGCSGALMFALGVGVGRCIEELEQLKEESNKRFDDAIKRNIECGKKIAEFRDYLKDVNEIYGKLRLRDAILKDKFRGIKNKKMREEFLNYPVRRGMFGRYLTIKDILIEIEHYEFDSLDKYLELLLEFEKKQHILDVYEEKPKQTKRGKKC